MKKTFRQFQPGTAEFVVHHAQYRASRGKNPSEPYLTYRNPRQALASARNISSAKESCEFIGSLATTLGGAILAAPDKPSFHQMDEDTIKVALRYIVANSSNEQEVRDRIRDELGCPYSPSISILSALSGSREARDLCLAMGAVTLKSGDLIQIMLYTGTGDIVQV